MNTHCIIYIHNYKLHFIVTDIAYSNILHRYEANSYFIQEIVSYTSIVLHNIYYYFKFLFYLLFLRRFAIHLFNVIVSTVNSLHNY